VSIGKKAVEEFLEAKKKKNEENNNNHQTVHLKSRIPISPTQVKDPLKNEEEVQILSLN